MNSDESIVLARIGKAHGIKGWVRLISFTDPLENIAQYPLLSVVKGPTTPAGNSLPDAIEIDGIRAQSGGFIAHIKGYDTPEIARELNGCELAVSRQSLPALEEGDYYWHQLEGLRVVNLEDQCFGRVLKILETGANDVLVVADKQRDAAPEAIDDRERLIPYLLGKTVLRVELENERILVDWQADYLE